jgi:hypothetical protein
LEVFSNSDKTGEESDAYSGYNLNQKQGPKITKKDLIEIEAGNEVFYFRTQKITNGQENQDSNQNRN